MHSLDEAVLNRQKTEKRRNRTEPNASRDRPRVQHPLTNPSDRFRFNPKQTESPR
jgi:hypothetical protein